VSSTQRPSSEQLSGGKLKITIESMISVARRTTGRVTRWKDGSMKKRWVAAGMLEAERSFRRIKGYRDMPVFVEALRREVNPTVATPSEYDHQAA
jgi:hypothetical protein